MAVPNYFKVTTPITVSVANLTRTFAVDELVEANEMWTRPLIAANAVTDSGIPAPYFMPNPSVRPKWLQWVNVITHDANASFERYEGTEIAIWYGSAQPSNAEPQDFWFDTSDDIMKANFTHGGGLGAEHSFFNKFQKNTRKIERQEAQTGPSSGTSSTIATITGAGIMENFWIATYNTSEIYDCVVEFYVDGESTPSVTADLGTLFTYHWHWAGGADYTVGTDHMTCIAGSGSGGGVFRFPIPYSDGLVVKLKNVVGGSAMIFWSQVFYTTLPASEVPPYRLKSLGANWDDVVTVTSGNTYEFMDLSDSGVLVWHGMVGTGVTNASWMERDITIVVDSTTTMQTTGLEDWFMGAFYFIGAPYGRPEAVCTRRYGNDASMGVDLVAAMGGIPFTTRLQMTLETEAAVTTQHSMSWLALYYQDV